MGYCEETGRKTENWRSAQEREVVGSQPFPRVHVFILFRFL